MKMPHKAPIGGIIGAIPRTIVNSAKRRTIMSKGQDSKKATKKDPAKTPKEKKADKKIKKDEKKK